MCGRYTASFTPDELQRRWALPDFADLRLPPAMPRFNVAATSLMPIIVERPAGRTLVALKWGFWPSWMTLGRSPPPINARAETLAVNGLFKKALSLQRCIVPATGFFEWQARPGEKRKVPHHIRLRDTHLFGFAGIYTPPTGDLPGTYAIVTTQPNELMAAIHNRMPVILEPEWEALWLDPSVTDATRVLPLLRPLAAENMEAYPVGYAVGAPANDMADLIAPLL